MLPFFFRARGFKLATRISHLEYRCVLFGPRCVLKFLKISNNIYTERLSIESHISSLNRNTKAPRSARDFLSFCIETDRAEALLLLSIVSYYCSLRVDLEHCFNLNLNLQLFQVLKTSTYISSRECFWKLDFSKCTYYYIFTTCTPLIMPHFYMNYHPSFF